MPASPKKGAAQSKGETIIKKRKLQLKINFNL